MYVSRKILDLLLSNMNFLGQDDKSIYCMIRQEIKNNPKYKNTRFMSEKRFYHCLELGELHKDDWNSTYSNESELYSLVSFIKTSFGFECMSKLYRTIEDENYTITKGQFDILLRILSLDSESKKYE